MKAENNNIKTVSVISKETLKENIASNARNTKKVVDAIDHLLNIMNY